MNKEYIIKNQNEIDALFGKKNKIANQYFNILYQSNENHFRFAISVGKKYGNAVERNLIKRRIRHILHSIKEKILAFDFVVVCKANAKSLNYEEMSNTLKELLLKANIMEERNVQEI